MAAPVQWKEALIRKLARGETVARGAMPCLGLVSLAEIEAEAQRAGLAIASGWGGELRPSLYRRVLGRRYDRQSPAGQRLHDAGASRWTGRCTVDGAATGLGRLLAWLFQFPPASTDAPIAVEDLEIMLPTLDELYATFMEREAPR